MSSESIEPITSEDNHCIVLSNFFRRDLLNALINFMREKEKRKQEFVLDIQLDVPRPLFDAWQYSERVTSLRFNYSILKSYKSDDVYTSGAYEFHADPPQFLSIPLFLCTLEGRATLEYIDNFGSVCEIKCVDNQVNLLESHLRHRVTPPSGGAKERLFLFFGWNSEI
jgi:hypothetical protein